MSRYDGLDAMAREIEKTARLIHRGMDFRPHLVQQYLDIIIEKATLAKAEAERLR